MDALRVVIADDHTLFRQGLRALFAVTGEILVVGEVARADELRAALAGLSCDVLLLDVEMERSTLPEVAGLAGNVAVIVLTADEGLANARRAMDAGARGIVSKRFAVETLADAVRVVASGGVWLFAERIGVLSGCLLASRLEIHRSGPRAGAGRRPTTGGLHPSM